MSVEDIRKRYNEIRASYETMAHGYQAGRDNRDEFNDTINWTHVDSDQLFDNGTDDAGNPIMGSPVNLAAQYHKPETTEDKSVWDNVRGFFGNMTEEISNTVSGHLQDVSEMEPDELSSVGSYMKDPSELLTLPLAGMKQAITLGAPTVFGAVDWLKNSAPDSFKASKLYADYFYTADEKREQRQKVEDYLGIDSAVVANNPELWEKAMKTIQRLEKLEKTPGMLNQDGNLDMNKVYAAMPYLKDIQEKRGTNAAAMALSSADGLKTISDVYSNAFTQFYGSIKTGIERGAATLQRQMIYGKAMWNARRLTDEEQAKIRENDAKMAALPQYSYTGIGSTVGAMVGSALENAPMILSSQGVKAAIGTAAGAVTAAATKNPAMAAKAAQWVGDAAAVAVMGLEIGASQYEQNVSKLDKNGNYLYTPQAAATLSFLQGGAEGVLEQYTLKQMGRAMFGLKEATSLAKLYERDAALKLAESGLSPKEAGRELIETRLRAAIASGALMVKAEAQEEFLQQASDMILENAAQVLTKGENADISSVEKILQDSTGAAMEALPAIMGFGVIGLAGHPVAHTRPILNARQHITDLMTSKIYRDIHENQYRMNVVEGVADNLGNIADLQKKDPKSVQIALDSQNRAFGMENTVVDVNALAKTENGAEIVETIAKEAGVSDEELSACQQGTGMLEVKTSVLQQISAPLDEAKRRNLFLNMTKDRQTLTPAQVQAEVAIINEAREAFKSATKDEQEKAVATFVEGNFAAGEERKLAEDVLLTDPNHPMAEIRSRKKNIQAQLDEILDPIKAGLRSGMKQGVDIVQTENGTARASNNAPWYRKWYADHGRAPSEQELDIIARDIALGISTPYDDYGVNDGTEEAQAYFADVEKQLSALDAEMATLNKVGEKLSDIRPGDVLATATLSPEARGVYHHLLSEMGKGNKDVQKSARAAALLAARMTDRLVALHREAGDKDYSAMDALPELLANAGETAQEKEAAQLRQEEVRTQKEAVRKQYESTAMWMKAPNGKDTNLTEEQWLLVRTPAFKSWFGDWEAEAEKQKYLNTTPIKVMENQIVEKGDISAKEAAFQWAEDNLPVQIVTRFGNVEINRTSIKDSLGHGFSQKKLDAITSLPEGMKVAAFIGEEPDFNGALLDNGYFCYPILYQGETQVVFCRARRDVNSNKVYVHEVWMEDEIKDIPLQTAAKFLNSKPHGGNALYKSILANFLNNSNTASKVVDENGEPLVVYHGTTGGDFAVFDRSYGSAEGDMGNGFYFTDQFDDVTENYEGGGPDFENKIARLAEKIEAEEEIDYEEAKERARKELDKGAALYETFLKIAYPAYVDHTLLFSDEAELYEEINREDYEDEDEYEEAIIQAQEDAWSDIVTNIVDKVNYEGYSVPEDSLRGIYWDAIMEGGISIAELKKQLANLDITDSNGDIANNEVLRITISELGYDGIVDSTVSDKFSNMNLNPETTHYIAFDPTQIKSVDNNGNFDPEDANIYHQEAARETAEERVNRISQEVFQTYLNDGIMKSVEETVAAEIGEYVNLDAMADPVEKDKVRDHLPYIRKMLADFNLMVVQKNKKYKDRLAAKIEYARRCFDNDERIQSRIVRQMDGNEGQGDVYSTGREAVPGRDDATGVGKTSRRSVSRVSAGVSSPVSGEKRGAREHFEKLYNETAKKHSENQGAFSHGLLEQSAWHGSPYRFPAFDLGAIGSGAGAQAHGWGLYFAKNQETAKVYKNDNGGLYEADIPDDDVLLGEQKTFREQPSKVKKGLWELIDHLTMEQLENWDDVLRLGKAKVVAKIKQALSESDGGNIYGTLVDLVAGDKEASLLLNKYGIKGISYDDRNTGPCYVIFDDKAVSILNRYEQAIKQEIKGNYDQAEAIIRLFEGADTSTFMHEMSHHYLSELKKLSERFPQSEAAKDYETIMQWASWQEGQVNAYAGTASAKEFQARDEAIRKAEKEGDEMELKRLKDVWVQERFARAFEEYLHSGDAPTSVLKQIFRRFKRWLSDIYKTVTGAGVRATSEVEAVMARMVATDAEIEAEALLRKAKRIEKAAPDLLDTDTESLMARWEEEAREEAKEKMLKRLLRELSKKDVEKHLAEYREKIELIMQDTPCWQAELMAKEVGDVGVVLGMGYTSIDAYKADLAENGGPYDEFLAKELEGEKKRYKEEMPNRETLLETAQEALATGKYNLQITALEEELLTRREEAYQKLPLKAVKALGGVEKAIEKAIEDDPDALGKAVTILKYAVNWTDEQAEMITALQEEIKALKEKSKEERTKARESFEEEVKSFKETILRNTVWLRGIRDAAEGKAKVYRDYARERLEDMTAAEATDARHWMREAQKEASASVRAITGAVQKKDGEAGAKTAQSAKTRQLVYEAMAKESFSLKRELSRIENHFARRQKTLANDKNGRVDLNHKYFINHLLYVYGLRKDDAIRPSGENAMTFTAMMAELRDVYNESNKVEDQGSGNIGEADMDVPEWLMAAALSKDPIKNYKHLTMDELRDLKTMVDFLYTTGRNKNRMVTLDMDIDDVVKELAENYGSRIAPPKQGQGIGKYMSELLKPETILEILGGKDGAFIKYIYNPIFKANEQESLMKEAESKALNEILDECYTKKERKRIPKEKLTDDKGNPVTLPDGTEMTRENLIAMALNWGNSGNRSRLMAGTKMNEPEIQALFEAHMRENDWKFVQAIWDHLEQYGDSVNDVMEKSTGNPLKRVPPEAFQVKVGDKIVELRGGYYPIVYDPEKSSRASEYDTLKDGQAVGGATAFGTGMGSTKKRAERPMPDSPLKLTLDVINKHINQQIHISAMRLACRDVYKLLGHRQVRAMIESTVGIPAYRELRGWVENIWQAPRGEQSRISRVTSRLRRNTVAAIMGYRVSTSLLNFANLAPMVDELGAVNAMAAMAEFIKNPRAMWEFVRTDSVFMRNRATNMDQDLAVQQEQSFGGSNEVAYNVRKYASWLLERTDMLTSVPTYYFRYQEVYNAALKEGKAEEVARNEAHAAAHAAVRKVVGSSDIIDQSFIQRSKSEIDKLFTPFYSFFNAMMNAVWAKYYEGKYAGKTVIVEENGEKKLVRAKEAFIKQYAGFVRSYLYRFVLMAAMETGIRMLMEKAARGGDDKKKREEWYRRFLRQWAANSVGSSLGGFPMINSVADFASGMITGDMYPSRRIGVISTAYERAVKPLSDIYSMAGKKGKTDFLTLGRDTTKAAASWYGIPDTLTDTAWNTARFLHDDYRFNRPDDLREYLFKSAFDKTLKAKRR
jgi:hypothetical protein